MKYIALFIAMTLGIFLTPQALAGTIINNVSVSASTGGNSAQGGVIKTGTSKAKVFLETIVNGETVEFIDKEVDTSDKSGVFIEEESSYESNDGNVKVESFINLQAGETSVENNIKVEEIQKEIVEENNIEEVVIEEKFFLTTFFQKLVNYVSTIFK